MCEVPLSPERSTLPYHVHGRYENGVTLLNFLLPQMAEPGRSTGRWKRSVPVALGQPREARDSAAKDRTAGTVELMRVRDEATNRPTRGAASPHAVRLVVEAYRRLEKKSL
jgi:hypothetical protein